MTNTIGTRATNAVSSFTAEEMKLSRAVGASRIVRAQLKAVTFSGNSERTGAIHWIEKKTAPEPSNPTRNESAIVLIDSTNESVTNTNVSAAKRKRPTIAITLRGIDFTFTNACDGPSRISSGRSLSAGNR